MYQNNLFIENPYYSLLKRKLYKVGFQLFESSFCNDTIHYILMFTIFLLQVN